LAGRRAMVWTGGRENPYLGFLALADALVVTSDSVNLASEACATGKPVYIADIEPESGRLAAFHEGLRRTGHTRRFAGRVDAWSHPPLDEAPRIGEILRRRLAETGRLMG
ncbi:MAG TPA: ELM1/GtrOC1 family putative glycosyltransferase, partial [Thalassobaculum sp.]